MGDNNKKKRSSSMKALIQEQIDSKLHQLKHAVGDVSEDIAQKLHLSPPPSAIPPAPEGDLFDLYGLYMDKKHYEDYYKARVKYEKNVDKQRKILGPLSATLSNKTPNLSAFGPHVRNGLPDEFRPVLWPLFMESHTNIKKEAGKYDELLKSDFTKVAVAVYQISKDLHRTFPKYGDESFRMSLKRVLQCYAAYNPALGYCQAMNFLAGGLLIFCSEEIAFWTLVYIVDGMLCEYFSNSMAGSIADCAVLEELMTMRMPQLMEHFTNIGLPVQLIVTQWLMCLFVNTLPPITAFQIWDMIFYHGPRIIFEVCLAIFKMNQKAIMQLDDQVEIIYYLNGAAAKLFDSCKLFDEMQALDPDEIFQLRVKHRVRINGEAKKKDNNKLIKYVESHARFGARQHDEMEQFFKAAGAENTGIDLPVFLKLLEAVLPQLLDTSDQNIYFDEDAPVSHKLFELFDVNGDNVVNYREVVSGISVMCLGTLEDRLSQCFKAFSDSEGHMTRQDLSALLSTLYGMYFERGFQNEVSFFTDMIFLEADLNHDGFLTYDEFEEASQLQPFLMKCFRIDSAVIARIASPKQVKPTQQLLTDPEEWVVM